MVSKAEIALYRPFSDGLEFAKNAHRLPEVILRIRKMEQNSI
jgi:hypothetical protein